MSRRRYISTTMSTDKRLNRLAVDYGDFAAMLYTWMVPHAADDTTLNGDIEELMAEVIPMRRDKTVADVEGALAGMAALGLIIWDKGRGIIRFPSAAFYAHQSFIKSSNRKEDWEEPEITAPIVPTAEISAEQRETPPNASSLSSPVSLPISSPDPLSLSACPPEPASAGKAPKALLPQKTDVTDAWLAEIRPTWDPLLRDFDEAVRFAMNSEYFRKKPDKRAYIESALKRQLEREGSRTNGNRNDNRRGVQGNPAGSAADEGLLERLTERTDRLLGLLPVQDVRG